MLKVIEHIKAYGLEKTLVKFKLKAKEYPHKVLIKYSQIDSDMSLDEVQDSRGLVLERDTWKIMSMSFRKFFNAAEGHAAKIDWDTARILEKLDGSLIHVYWDWVLEKWCVGTTGTAEAEGEVNNKFGTTFADLFWNTVNNDYYCDYFDTFEEALNNNKDRTYVFELCTPYNIVVKPHAESSVSLLAIRDRNTLLEVSYEDLQLISGDIGIPLVKAYDINATNSGHLIKTFEGMPYVDEGYVVVDADFNRIKLKNPAYVAVHHLKSKTSEHAIMEIVKTNEIDEFAATFPERSKEIFALKVAYDKLTNTLTSAWEELATHLPKNITKEESKKYAMKVFEVSTANEVKHHNGLFFGLKDKKIDSVNEYLKQLDNKRLYNELEVEI
jgi:hypothetical protein